MNPQLSNQRPIIAPRRHSKGFAIKRDIECVIVYLELMNINCFIIELLKEKDSTNRQLEGDLINCRKELEITSERLRKIEEDQNAQLTQSESTTNYLERRIHELDKVFILTIH